VHITIEKSSDTQRAKIDVPGEELTYAPSIRKMISPPRELTTRAQREVKRSRQSKLQHDASRNTKQVETQSKLKHNASQNTKEVDTQSKSKDKAGQHELAKEVEQQEGSVYQNQTKASRKMRRNT
jgi:hypothetical protein